MAETMEMKVTSKKPTGFYVKSTVSFLKGIDAKEASEGKEAVAAKPPVDELKISGLGDCISTVVACAQRAMGDGLATIAKVETDYPTMPNEKGCPQMVILLKRK
eukprot:TRINITY_DN4495_c0_g1_i1.p1 TRINITY_DN4495_c0_g1~~TRINITY_DN4495_c0_g1_i1.p1  ORF type:complete len:104 (-),score=34.97 TRINITY_DN4495_c0_g1_i1:43-354(-)